MSFLRCCVGGDARPRPEAIRPVGGGHHVHVQVNGRAAAKPPAGAKKIKVPEEVFFDPNKPDGQLSSVTDPPNSAREFTDSRRRHELAAAVASAPKPGGKGSRDRSKGTTDRDTGTHGHTAVGDGDDLNAPDNNGLTRGQNFMKVEKWMRDASRYQQTPITPGKITNIEDENTQPENAADPPSDIDRLPQSVVSSSTSGLARSNR